VAMSMRRFMVGAGGVDRIKLILSGAATTAAACYFLKIHRLASVTSTRLPSRIRNDMMGDYK
jgi:hypothetical protein